MNNQNLQMTTERLPDFIIIGAMRAGTTSLHNYFELHPQVAVTTEKEPDFFIESKYGNGLDWYKSRFQGEAEFLGEASPNYSKVDVFPGVPKRIHDLLPDVKIIYVVRDPVERFVSQYKHMLARGFDLPDPANMCATPGDLPDIGVRLGLDRPYHHILSVSSYARQLRAYLEHFAMDQILVVEFEALYSKPVSELDRIQDFLGLKRLGPAALPSLNRSAELGRVPLPVLRSARDTRMGKWMRDKMTLRTRDRMKKLIALPFPSREHIFEESHLARVRRDLGADTAAFREMTDMPFDSWSI
ncbi:sulfotransferase [uncultured Tateyamaria sp.]|uniref:sulfotransferase family protein n=1 Tax=uncultured Tateyamaria sp. TaxID=455651 RepID=UPI00262182B1|nr:sulfotransferase [uncultured Tateyamaria sp.]